ncbi:pyridoxal-phosphate dependent enzyme [Candidatus Zixiibacteriota bacterium]
MQRPDLDQIRTAHQRIAPYIHRTPVLTSAALDAMCDASLFFKCENLQKAGAFKARGASNAVFSLDDETAARGVVTHSSGNHAAALSWAAGLRGIPAHIVMPSNAPAVKRAAVEGYGGNITLCEPTLASRESTANEVIARTGAELIHPYDDYRIIEAQATAVIELFEEAGDLDVVLGPVGGGGLIAGTALAVHHLGLPTQVIACEPANADDALRSFREGTIQPSIDPDTIADGLRTQLSERTFDIIRDLVHDIVTVTEEEIATAMRTVWERMKTIIEPSSAVPVAAALSGNLPIDRKRVGIIISGGNVDLGNLPF